MEDLFQKLKRKSRKKRKMVYAVQEINSKPLNSRHKPF